MFTCLRDSLHILFHFLAFKFRSVYAVYNMFTTHGDTCTVSQSITYYFINKSNSEVLIVSISFKLFTCITVLQDLRT